ncbi:type II toxin-antitoxin system PemK/MazF family toxin [Streptomyces sp. JL7001]|uniref:type II toxin-antitoxin system PemK/MazF family toxin n=1 Tax=Streptomyces sp. JL7001 TaxID=3445784 RepID=UPI003F79F754
MIRGAVYRVDLGDAKRGHEQRGKRFGLVLSPSGMAWSVVTIVPTSTSAQDSPFRPELEIGGRLTRLLVDQIRTVDVSFVHGARHLVGEDGFSITVEPTLYHLTGGALAPLDAGVPPASVVRMPPRDPSRTAAGPGAGTGRVRAEVRRSGAVTAWIWLRAPSR